MAAKTVLKLLRTGGNVASVAVAGREYKVVDDIIQCTEHEAVEIAPALASHGFALEVIDDGTQPPPNPAPPIEPGAQLSGSFEAAPVKGSRTKEWAIFDGDNPVHTGLTKDEGEAFNTLTVEEKANRVADLRKAAE